MCPEILKDENDVQAATETAVPTAKVKTVKAKTVKKTTAKVKSVKPKIKAKKAPKKEGKKVDRHMADMPASERRQKFLSCLKKRGATSAGTAIPGTALAKALGFTNYDVYMLGYKTSPLIVDGLVKVAKMEDVHGLSYYLTAKGLKA
jgi:hypothetical protein